MKLNRTGSNWNELERNKINENWDIIEGGYNDVVGQITDEVVGHLIDSAKLNWKEPVETEADLPKDAEVGETRMVRESDDGVSHVYRYNGEEWELIQEIDVSLVNEVDRRLTAQLAEIKQDAQETLMHSVDRKTIVSFSDDDGDLNVMKVLRDKIFAPEGVPFSVFVNTSTIGTKGKLSWTDLSLLQKEGCSIHSHGHEHLNSVNNPPHLVDENMKKARKILNDKGFNGDIFAYPYGAVNNDVEDIARKNSVAAFSTYGVGYNEMPLNTFYIKRLGGVPVRDLQTCIDYVDNAPEGSWIIFFGHAYEPEYNNPQTVEDYRSLIKHIKSRGIDIVSIEEGLNRKGNLLDAGRRDKQYIRIGRDGSIVKSDFNDHSVSNDTPATYFPNGITRIYYNYNDAKVRGFPGNMAGSNITSAAGTLVTSKIQPDYYSDASYATFQLYIAATSNYVFKRRWDVYGSAWGSWEIIFTDIDNYPYHYLDTTLNKYTANSPISDYPARQIHSFLHNSSAKDGFPGTEGLVTTYRLGFGTWTHQEYRALKDKKVYHRYWSDGKWSTWETSAMFLSDLTRVMPKVSIDPRSTYDLITDVSSISMKHIYNVFPKEGLSSGIMFNHFIPKEGRIVIRLVNITESTIKVPETTWLINRIS